MWISVKDKLPENEGLFVLRLDDKSKCLGGYFQWVFNYETGLFVNLSEKRFLVKTQIINQIQIEEDLTHKVTHYLEIPELLESRDGK